MHMNMTGLGGVGGLIVLVLDLWALISIVNARTSTGTKVIWCLLVFFLPLLGFLLWLLFGPKAPGRG